MKKRDLTRCEKNKNKELSEKKINEELSELKDCVSNLEYENKELKAKIKDYKVKNEELSDKSDSLEEKIKDNLLELLSTDKIRKFLTSELTIDLFSGSKIDLFTVDGDVFLEKFLEFLEDIINEREVI